MDILENGSDRPPLGRAPRTAGFVLLVAALLAGVLLARHHRPGPVHTARPSATASLPATPSPSATARPELVVVGGNSSFSVTPGEFVVRYQLTNFNPLPVWVSVELPLDTTAGFSEMTSAVMHDTDSWKRPIGYADVATAATARISMDPRAEAQLLIAGQVNCPVRHVALPTGITVVVGDTPILADLPAVFANGPPAILREACSSPAPSRSQTTPAGSGD